MKRLFAILILIPLMFGCQSFGLTGGTYTDKKGNIYDCAPSTVRPGMLDCSWITPEGNALSGFMDPNFFKK